MPAEELDGEAVNSCGYPFAVPLKQSERGTLK